MPGSLFTLSLPQPQHHCITIIFGFMVATVYFRHDHRQVKPLQQPITNLFFDDDDDDDEDEDDDADDTTSRHEPYFLGPSGTQVACQEELVICMEALTSSLLVCRKPRARLDGTRLYRAPAKEEPTEGAVARDFFEFWGSLTALGIRFLV